MADTVYRFGRCEVRPGRREVRVDGVARALEPRPFDLLVYLIEHGDRIVSRNELLDRLWHGEPVSQSTVAQAVKKVRQAIGDDAGEPTLITTTPRAGYRFVGILAAQPAPAGESDPASRTGPPTAAVPGVSPPGVVTLALLPFENRTGRPELDWIELGLMSLVAKALEADRRLGIPALPMLLSALSALPAQAEAQERMDIVTRLLGASHVVHAAVSLEGEAFCLEFRIGPTTAAGKIRLVGAEPTALGQQMARSLQSALCAVDGAADAALEFKDPLVNQALARCLQAIGMERWPQALHLLDVVLDIAPGHPGALLQKMRVLVAMDNCASFDLGAELLAAAGPGDSRLVADVHLLLGDACLRRRLVVDAERHIDAALHAAAGREGREWLLYAGLLRASVALGVPDFAAARKLLDDLQPACDRDDGNQLHRIRFLTLQATLCGVSGRLAESLPITRRIAELQLALHLRPGRGRTLSNLALIMTQMGHLEEAVVHGEESLALTLEARMPTSIALSAVVLCRAYHLLRRPGEIRQVVGVFDSLEVDRARFSEAYHLTCQALHAATLDRHAQAALLWRETRALLKQAGQMLDHRSTFNDLMSALLRSGQLDAATQACAEEQALPAKDTGLTGSLLYWSGLRSFLQGDRVLACRQLSEAAELIPDGLWRANARIDAAWLHLEMDDPATARALLRGIEPWLAGYPPGMAVLARMLYAEADIVAACDLQGRYLERAAPGHAFHHQLARHYAQAAHRLPASGPAPAPVLPSMA